jgi:hypothetical protein
MALNLNGFADNIISFGQNNPLIALATAVIFLFLLFRRPKLILSLLLITLISAGVYYLIMVASLAKDGKQRLIHKSEESSKINEK